MAYHILCIDDDAEFLLTLKIQLKKAYQVSTTQSLKDAVVKIQTEQVDLVLLDVRLGSENGIDGLSQIKALQLGVDVVMVSGQRDPKLIVSAIRAGASDYLCKPFATDELFAVIEKTQKLKGLRDRQDALIRDFNVKESERPLIGDSQVFRDLLHRVQCVRGHNANVLIEGESGTGKELLARHIHALEDRPQRPFIAVNCAAIPDGLIESELFGHEKGAFSGAFQRKIGKFELASGGDIFLDEINSLKPELQAKILRVVQEKEIYRVGGTTPIRTDFRVIAATNSNLDEMVAAGAFRMDLFHRLRVVSFRIPPLRERREDIDVLIKHFMKKFSKPGLTKRLDDAVVGRILDYSWPGNVRELENLIHSLIIMSPETEITLKDLPVWLSEKKSTESQTTLVPKSVAMPTEFSQVLPLKIFVQKAEQDYVASVLTMKQGDKTRTAKILGISRTSLYEKLKGVTLN